MEVIRFVNMSDGLVMLFLLARYFKHLQIDDSDITCPEISSDDEQAGHSANQSKTLPDI